MLAFAEGFIKEYNHAVVEFASADVGGISCCVSRRKDLNAEGVRWDFVTPRREICL